MKVTMESAPVEEFKTGTLYVYDQNDTKYVVLVTGLGGSKFSGTVVASNTNQKPVGYTISSFNRSAFKPFHGRITMEA